MIPFEDQNELWSSSGWLSASHVATMLEVTTGEYGGLRPNYEVFVYVNQCFRLGYRYSYRCEPIYGSRKENLVGKWLRKRCCRGSLRLKGMRSFLARLRHCFEPASNLRPVPQPSLFSDQIVECWKSCSVAIHTMSILCFTRIEPRVYRAIQCTRPVLFSEVRTGRYSRSQYVILLSESS